MIAILFENISEFYSDKIDYNKISFTDFYLYKIYQELTKTNNKEVIMINHEDLINNKNYDLIICSNNKNLENNKNFLYILYDDDNKYFTFTNTNTDSFFNPKSTFVSKKPKKHSLSSPLFVEDMFDIDNEKCFCFMHFDDTSMEYVHLIEKFKTLPVVYRYDGNKFKIPDNHGQRFYNFNFIIRNDILSKTKYYVDFRKNIEINIHAEEALYHNCIVYLPDSDMNRINFNHPNIRLMNKKIDPEKTFCDEAKKQDKITINMLVKDILNKHMIVKKSKIYI